jgi:hypothetical protein
MKTKHRKEPLTRNVEESMQRCVFFYSCSIFNSFRLLCLYLLNWFAALFFFYLFCLLRHSISSSTFTCLRVCNTYSTLSSTVLESVCQFVYRGTSNAVWRTQNNRSEMLSEAARKSACQFVYCATLGAICRTQNIRGPI